jgi:hypothetical protein
MYNHTTGIVQTIHNHTTGIVQTIHNHTTGIVQTIYNNKKKTKFENFKPAHYSQWKKQQSTVT